MHLHIERQVPISINLQSVVVAIDRLYCYNRINCEQRLGTNGIETVDVLMRCEDKWSLIGWEER